MEGRAWKWLALVCGGGFSPENRGDGESPAEITPHSNETG
jgi:hypothetical protein